MIELKKDSGYDDVYEQTKNYVEWLSANRAKAGQTVRGIICLHAPIKALIEKVRADGRMRLFEYRIAYTEIC